MLLLLLLLMMMTLNVEGLSAATHSIISSSVT